MPKLKNVELDEAEWLQHEHEQEPDDAQQLQENEQKIPMPSHS